MTSYLKSTGAAKEQSADVFLHRAQEQLMGDGGSYHCKVGFKDLRKKPTKYPLSSHAKGQFVAGQASRLLNNNRPPRNCQGHYTGGQARGAMGINQTVNDTGEQGLARMRYEEWLSIPFERDCFGLQSGFQPSVPILKKAKARQGSRRAKETPRMATTMN
jgi:hypothetical protein